MGAGERALEDVQIHGVGLGDGAVGGQAKVDEDLGVSKAADEDIAELYR